ncbi:MAG: M6 family metalloprotease domain-containing protein [Candidatus Electrothrix sp. AR4]|nr:M6 family metalloprotease domain-containing protein [Candidatus Electrothrix sp. AR4]
MKKAKDDRNFWEKLLPSAMFCKEKIKLTESVNRKKRGFMNFEENVCKSCRDFFLILILLVFSCSVPRLTYALQPADLDEIEQLKAEGKFESSLEAALKIGNHKVKPYLVDKLKVKLKRAVLRSQGISESLVQEIAPAPPPAMQGGPLSTGAPKVLALLIDFPDHAHINSANNINSSLYGEGEAANYPYESMANFFDRSSHGLLDLSGGTTLGWYRTAYNRSTISETVVGRENLIKEALNYYNGIGHDFSVYDNDGDGDIDYLIVMWTGPTGAWATFWWAWNLGWSDGAFTLDGKTLSNYSWQQESNVPSVVIHETGHSLGLPDLYDYDDSAGPTGGVGGFDTMDAAGDINCFFKWMLDWITPKVVDASQENLMLDDPLSSTDAILIWNGISSNDIFSEFFMVENRQDVGNDTSLWFAPDGLAIWHIDAVLDSSGSGFYFDNSYTDHKLVRLMEADGLEEIETGDGWADNGDLYSVSDVITHVTTPSSKKYDGSDSCVRIWNVVDWGTTPGDKISAIFRPTCTKDKKQVVQASQAVIIGSDVSMLSSGLFTLPSILFFLLK